MKKTLIIILIYLAIIGLGVFIGYKFINKTPSSGLTIPIYSCTALGYDGSEYTSTYYGAEPENAISCEIKTNYKCMYDVCEVVRELSGDTKYSTAQIFDGNETKGGYYIINNKGKRTFGPYYEIKVIPYHYLAKKSPNEKYSYYSVSYKGDKIELIDKNKYDDVYTITIHTDIGLAYVGIVDGKYGLIGSGSKNKFEYDNIQEANYHYDISCAIAVKDGKQNLINSSSETIFDEWHDYVQSFEYNKKIYLVYADKGFVSLGSYDPKIDANGGTSSVEREFHIIGTYDVNYDYYLGFSQDGNTIFINTDNGRYSLDLYTKLITKL